MARDVRGAFVLAAAERYFTLALNFGTLIAVSRLLSPAEIGLAAIAHAVTLFCIALREFAPAQYIVQCRRLTAAGAATAATLALCAGGLAALLLAASGPWLAAVFAEPRFVSYCAIAAAALLLELPSLHVVARLRRGFAFGRAAIPGIATQAIYAVCLVASAASGAGMLAFAAGWLAAAAAGFCATLIVARDMLPRRLSLRGWRRVTRFGRDFGVENGCQRLYEQLPYLALGGMLGPIAAGLFHRALSLAALPDKILLGGMSALLLPAFAQAARSGRDMRDVYREAVAAVTALLWPALLLVALLAEPLTAALLGAQWAAVAPYLRVLALAGLFAFSSEIAMPLLASIGAMRAARQRALVLWPLSAAILLTAAVLGGLAGCVAAALAGGPLQLGVTLWFVRRHLGVTARAVGLAVLPSAAVAGISVAGPALYLALRGTPAAQGIGEAACLCGAAVIVWAVAMVALRHPSLRLFGLDRLARRGSRPHPAAAAVTAA